MTPNTRLRLSVLMILFSVCYAVLVASDRELAGVVAIGYIALLLTAFVTTSLWKKDK